MILVDSSDSLYGAVSTSQFERDPYPVFRAMLDSPPWRAPSGAIVIAKHASVHEVLVNHESYGQHLAPWPNFHRLNPPEHTRLRRLVGRAFTPRSIRVLQPDIERVSAELLEEVGPQFDVIEDYAYRLPSRIIADIIGVPYEDAELWRAWLLRMGQFNFENPFSLKDEESHGPVVADAQKANREQAEYFIDIIKQRQKQKGDDIVSRLIDAREDDETLTEEEVLYALVLLLQGGLHTTVHQIGNTIRALVENPEQLAAVRDDPALVPGAVEEGLRYDGTLRTEIRVVRRPTVLEGEELAEGETVITVNAAANRDPRMFESPEQFDIRRPNAGSHLGFGFGIHFCIGAPLARAELIAAVRDLSSLPELRLAGQPQEDEFFRVGGLASLPVTWDAGVGRRSRT
jgi:cytochrome P450